MQNDILFDNIYIGHSVEEALALQKETFDVKKPVEKAEEEKDKPKDADKPKPKSPMDLKFMDDPVLYVREKFDLFVDIAKRDPIQAIQFVPEIAGGIGLIVVTLLALLLGGLGAGAAQKAPSKEQVKAKSQQVKEKAVETKNNVAEQVTSSAEVLQEETKRRTTRSSAQS